MTHPLPRDGARPWGPRAPHCPRGSPAHHLPPSVPGPQEDTAAALQRLVELTAPRVTLVRSLHVQYRLIRELGSGSYGRVLLARPRHGGEFSHRRADSRIAPLEGSQKPLRQGTSLEGADGDPL